MEGQAYFRNKFLLDNTKGILDELKNNFYVYPAVVPPMTWAKSEIPAAPSSPSLSLQENGIRMSWKASTSLPGGIYYRVYASDAYPVDTEKAQNLIVTRTDSCQYTFIASLFEKEESTGLLPLSTDMDMKVSHWP